MSAMTPYAAAKIVNARLVEEGIEKEIPPQMMYTYAKKGYIESVVIDSKTRITSDGLSKWLVGYVNKLTKKVTIEIVDESDSSIDENQMTIDFE